MSLGVASLGCDDAVDSSFSSSRTASGSVNPEEAIGAGVAAQPTSIEPVHTTAPKTPHHHHAMCRCFMSSSSVDVERTGSNAVHIHTTRQTMFEAKA